MSAAHLKQSVTCLACGYDLRGLPPTGRCPECGKPVAETLRQRHAFFRREEYERIRRGLWLLLLGTLLPPIGLASVIVANNITSWAPACGITLLAPLSLALYSLAERSLLSVHWFGGSAATRGERYMAVMAGTAAFIGAFLLIIVLWLDEQPGTPGTLLLFMAGVLLTASGLRFLPSLYALSRICDRLHDGLSADLFRVLAFVTPLAILTFFGGVFVLLLLDVPSDHVFVIVLIVLIVAFGAGVVAWWLRVATTIHLLRTIRGQMRIDPAAR